MSMLLDPRVAHLSISRNDRNLFDFVVAVDDRRVHGSDFESIHAAYEAILTTAFVDPFLARPAAKAEA